MVTGVNVTVSHVLFVVGYVAACTGCHAPSASRYSRDQEAGGRIQFESWWNWMPTDPTCTGACHWYDSQSFSVVLVVPRYVPHWSGGSSAVVARKPSLTAVVRIGGCSVKEAVTFASSATLGVSRNRGSSARVCVTGSIRSPSHVISSIATERRKCPPPTASFVW